MTDLDPNHPFLIAGRRHARDVIEDGARIVRLVGETKTADAAATLSTALQLTVSAALVDGYEPREAYEAASGFLAWMIGRLPPQDRQGVLAAMVKSVVDQIADWPATEPVN